MQPGRHLRAVDPSASASGSRMSLTRRGLARARHAGDATKLPSGTSTVDVLAGCARGTRDRDDVRRCRAGASGHWDRASTRQVLTGQRVLVLEQALIGAACTISPPCSPAPGPMSTIVIGDCRSSPRRARRRAPCCRDHASGQGFDQALVVALMQPDRWLIQHVQHPDQARTDLATRAGSAEPHRPRGWPRCVTARGSRGRRRAGTRDGR